MLAPSGGTARRPRCRRRSGRHFVMLFEDRTALNRFGAVDSAPLRPSPRYRSEAAEVRLAVLLAGFAVPRGERRVARWARPVRNDACVAQPCAANVSLNAGRPMGRAFHRRGGRARGWGGLWGGRAPPPPGGRGPRGPRLPGGFPRGGGGPPPPPFLPLGLGGPRRGVVPAR